MDFTWNYTNQREYVERIHEGMPPVIISAVVTGGHQKSGNPAVPVTAEEQAEAAAAVFEAGATIVHIHARQAADPTQPSHEADRYREINEMMRAKAPQILVDNSQGVADLSSEGSGIVGTAHYYKSAPIEAGPDIMALNPGPMTFRGGAGTRQARPKGLLALAPGAWGRPRWLLHLSQARESLCYETPQVRRPGRAKLG